MSLHAQFVDAVRHLYPSASFRSDVLVQDDGAGPYLKAWNLPGSPPTDAEIDAAVAQIPTALIASQKTAAKAIMDAVAQDGRIQRASAQLVIDELNVLRAWLASFKIEVAASTTLADLKTRVAGLPATPARTKAQAITAIKAAVDAE